MTSRPLVIVGAGGFAREVLDVVEAINAAVERGFEDVGYEFLGFLDDGEPDERLLSERRTPVLGNVRSLAELAPEVGYVIGIGDGPTRRRIDDIGIRSGRSAPVLIHPSATHGFDVRFGPGTIVCAQAAVTTNITLGRHVHLNLGSTVGHDAVIGDYVTVSPLAAISGQVRIEDEVLIGSGAVINQHLTIGRGAVIGSGAAVVRDIDPGVVAVGVPARPREPVRPPGR